MLLIVDDERTWFRNPECGITITVRTVADAITCLESITGITEVSLDHDLGPDEDIRALVHWMIDNKRHNKIPNVQFIYVHSMNPVGAEWIVDMLKPHFVYGYVQRISLNAIGTLL